ncbi:MAG: hypothetical protein AB1679_04535 [Actinomycetota bacterium]|jgi:hypothetical protein
MKRARSALVALAVGTALLAGWAVPSGAASDSGDRGRVSVVSGVLSVAGFGARVGLPLICSAGFGVVTAAVPDANVANAGARVTEGCVTYGAEGAKGFAELNDGAGGLAALNPILDLGVDAAAGALTTIGKSGGPFGETFVELGNFVAFFHS